MEKRGHWTGLILDKAAAFKAEYAVNSQGGFIQAHISCHIQWVENLHF